MGYITTFTGEDFDPTEPDINKIKIEDIAHALSLICRANGHFIRFYSVGQHCINCANEAKARGLPELIQFACLFHDASEAYISDITSPVKKHLCDYREIEIRLQDMIYKKFLNAILSDKEYLIIKQIDDDILKWEFHFLMERKIYNELPRINSICHLNL